MHSETDHFNPTYRELAALIGVSDTIKLWKRFSGTSVTFPIHIYTREYMNDYIGQHMGKIKNAEIARKFGISERRVQQIIHDIRVKDIKPETEQLYK